MFYFQVLLPPPELDDRIVARVDLKADRKNKQLLVLAAHDEAAIDIEKTAGKLAAELVGLAAWLDLDSVRVSRKGLLAKMLIQRLAYTRR